MTSSVSLTHARTHTWQTSAVSCTSESLHSSFSRFRMSGLAALMSIFRLEVGVQGSQRSIGLLSPTFLGVVRGPMAAFFSGVSTVLALPWGKSHFHLLQELRENIEVRQMVLTKSVIDDYIISYIEFPLLIIMV